MAAVTTPVTTRNCGAVEVERSQSGESGDDKSRRADSILGLPACLLDRNTLMSSVVTKSGCEPTRWKIPRCPAVVNRTLGIFRWFSSTSGTDRPTCFHQSQHVDR